MMYNITNTMCRLSDLTQEEYERLREEMPYGQFDFGDNEPYIGVTKSGVWGTWAGVHKPTIILYSNMMQLLKGKDMNKQTAQEQIAVMQVEMDKLKAIIDRPEVKTGRVMSVCDLERNSLYYSVSHTLLTSVSSLGGHAVDSLRTATGTAFHDKESAERHLEYLKLEQELRRAQAADGGEGVEAKYNVILNNRNGKLTTSHTHLYHEKISFNTEAARDAFKKAHTDEQLTLLIRGV
jgi:hypothetical protein